MPLGSAARVVRGPTQVWTFWGETEGPNPQDGFLWMCSDLDPTPRRLSLSRYDPWYIAISEDVGWDVMFYHMTLVLLKWWDEYDPEAPNTRFWFYTSPDEGQQWYAGWWTAPYYP